MANIGKMIRQIQELDSLDNFYENVRKIVGFYDDNVFIEDCDIKELQRIADAKYDELNMLENNAVDEIHDVDEIVIDLGYDCDDEEEEQYE